MKVSIDELHQGEKYELIETVDYRSILGFIKRNIKPREAVMWAFYIFLGISAIVFGIISGMLLANKEIGISTFLGSCVMLVFISMIALIPLHELLHGLAFKLIGAGKLVFGANLKEMVFYVTVHKFVLNRKQFYFIALTPFVVFSAFFIPFLFNSNSLIRCGASLLLSFHTSCCIGDFALMAYFAKVGRNENVYTYDDASTKTSYFFRKNKP